MLIDWFTVAAQVINFLVLVLLLRRFLYEPITRAMAERKRGIEERLAAAERARAEATAQSQRLQSEIEDYAAERDERVRRLREELDTTRHANLQQARADIDELSARWRAAVQREKDGFLVELRRRIGEQFVEALRRALRDLADESLETRVVKRFLDCLGDLDATERETLVDAAQRNGARLRLRTAFPLSPELRDRLETAVRTTIGAGYELQFEVAPALLGGVELRGGAQTLEWTFDDYLASFESALTEAFGEQGPGRWESKPGG